jgi:hypothetical protein
MQPPPLCLRDLDSPIACSLRRHPFLNTRHPSQRQPVELGCWAKGHATAINTFEECTHSHPYSAPTTTRSLTHVVVLRWSPAFPPMVAHHRRRGRAVPNGTVARVRPGPPPRAGTYVCARRVCVCMWVCACVCGCVSECKSAQTEGSSTHNGAEQDRAPP